MSPKAWQRRLAKRGLRARFLEHGPGYVGDDVQTVWTVLVERISGHHDTRFLPLIGVGMHSSRDVAVKAAVAHFGAREAEQKREQVVLALAGEP